MIAFEDATMQHCMTPISGSGPRMLVCGKPPMPGRRCCADCHKVLYIQPVGKALKEVEGAAIASGRRQKMTVSETD